MYLTKGEQIGSGNRSTVYCFEDKCNGVKKAIKRIDCFKEKTPRDTIEKEVRIMEKLNHKYIINFDGFQQSKNSVLIIMEYAERGSIKDLIETIGGLQEATVSKYCRQILEGLTYLHNNQIVHRDLKCANILLDDRGNCKLSDFGISKEDEDLHSRSGCRTDCGSFHWRSPESFKGEYGWKTDIWSFGCTVLEMLNKVPPYVGMTFFEAMTKIVKEGIIPNFPSDTSDSCITFTTMCIERNPMYRPSTNELLQQQFIRMFHDS